MSNLKIPPPPKKTSGKGTPPPMNESSDNLTKNMDSDLVAFNFRVPAEFRKKVRQYALDNDSTAVQVMIDAINNYIERKR